jgi:uncharacterized protein
MRIEYLYRYPVKGLTAEALEVAEVEEGGCIPWDRAFALAQGDAEFDPAQPRWLQKTNFMCQMKNARIAALFSFFNPRSGMLAIRAPDGTAVVENALTAVGRERIGGFLAAYLGEDARGTPRFHHVPGHSFCDQRRKVVSMINLAACATTRPKWVPGAIGGGSAPTSGSAAPRHGRSAAGWTGSCRSAARCYGSSSPSPGVRRPR